MHRVPVTDKSNRQQRGGHDQQARGLERVDMVPRMARLVLCGGVHVVIVALVVAGVNRGD